VRLRGRTPATAPGILLQVPDAFLRKVAPRSPAAAGEYGVGSCSCRRTAEHREPSERSSRGSWPRKGSSCSAGATCRPTTRGRAERGGGRTVFSQRSSAAADALDGPERACRFERKLYVIRKRIEHDADRCRIPSARSASTSSACRRNTLIYKGMLTASQIETMFPDLARPDMESALALVHQRFSTNTFPSWPLAHPYRYIAHNGEINTLRGNINWMRAAKGCSSPLLGDDLEKICRSSAKAAATRRRSTTCSSSW
jgi:glutamate synthase domain-containing protein 1